MSLVDEKLIFATRLRQEREELGLMQKEMAQKLNIPSNTYNGYETGKRSPNLEVAKQISDALDISVDYLLGRTDIKRFEDFPPEVKRVTELFAGLDTPKAERLEKLLRELLEK